MRIPLENFEIVGQQGSPGDCAGVYRGHRAEAASLRKEHLVKLREMLRPMESCEEIEVLIA